VFWFKSGKLRSKKASVRLAAVQALATSNGSRTLNKLIECVRDEDWRVRLAVVQGLSRFDDPRALGALVECATKDKDYWHQPRLAAVQLLCASSDPRAVGALVECLKDRERQVRWTSGFGLAARGDARAVPALVEFCSGRRGNPPAVEREVLNIIKQFASSGDHEAARFIIQYVDPDETYKNGDGKADQNDIALVERFAAMGNPDAVNCIKKRQTLPRYESTRNKISSGTGSRALSEIHWSSTPDKTCSKTEMLSGLAELTNLAPASGRVSNAIEEVIRQLTRERDADIRTCAAICLARLVGGGREPVEALLEEASRGGDARRKYFSLEALLALARSTGAAMDARQKERIDALLKERVDKALREGVNFQNSDTASWGYRDLSILPDERCAERLLEQLQADQGRRSYNDYCYEALKRALTDHPDKFSNDLLRKLISLENIAWLESYPSGGPAVRPIDCREVRELANDELRRRGEAHSIDETGMARRLEEMKEKIAKPSKAARAVSAGNLDEVKSLLPDRQAYKEFGRDDEHTALYFAAAHGRLEVVKYLLSIGADPNEHCGGWDSPSTTPYRAAKDHPDIRKLLAAHGGRD
jgi:CTP:molybdopterin cytidylyltransferase MocA